MNPKYGFVSMGSYVKKNVVYICIVAEIIWLTFGMELSSGTISKAATVSCQCLEASRMDWRVFPFLRFYLRVFEAQNARR